MGKAQTKYLGKNERGEHVVLVTPPDSVTDKVARVVWRINQLRRFPLKDEDIEDWSKTLVRLMPLEDLRKLEFVIDQMITGELDYNPDEGIKNLFRNVKAVIETDGKFEILKANY